MKPEQQIQIRSPHGHLHLSRRYPTAPWKVRGQCPVGDLLGIAESLLNVARRLREQEEAKTEPTRPPEGEAESLASDGHEAPEEGGAPSERVSREANGGGR